MFNLLRKEFPQRLKEACELFDIPCTQIKINEKDLRYEVWYANNLRGFVRIPEISSSASPSDVEKILQTLPLVFPTPMTHKNRSQIKTMREQVEYLRWEVKRIVSELYYNSGKEETPDETEEFSSSIWALNTYHENNLLFQSPQSNSNLVHQSRLMETSKGIKGKKSTSLGLSWR